METTHKNMKVEITSVLLIILLPLALKYSVYLTMYEILEFGRIDLILMKHTAPLGYQVWHI